MRPRSDSLHRVALIPWFCHVPREFLASWRGSTAMPESAERRLSLVE
jgi:hypothetical protein